MILISLSVNAGGAATRSSAELTPENSATQAAPTAAKTLRRVRVKRVVPEIMSSVPWPAMRVRVAKIAMLPGIVTRVPLVP